jgi:hypothetical protein
VSGLRCAAARGKFPKQDRAKTRITPALSRFAKFIARARGNENFFRAVFARRRRYDSGATAHGAACAQNQAESLLFFFRCSNPVAVQIDSRLH